MNVRPIFAAALAVLLVLFAVPFLLFGGPAGASEGDECVPQDAWTETVEHPEVTEVIHHEAVTDVIHHPAVPAVTTNEDTWFSYNPAVDVDGDVTTGYPVGDREADKDNGWQVNNGNHAGQYDDPNFAIGAPWQEGGGGGSWFFVIREVVVATEEVPAWEETVVVEEAWDETVVVEEAWTETIEHEAVTCEDDEDPEPPVEEPCPDDSRDPETCEPTDPTDPEGPTGPGSPIWETETRTSLDCEQGTVTIVSETTIIDPDTGEEIGGFADSTVRDATKAECPKGGPPVKETVTEDRPNGTTVTTVTVPGSVVVRKTDAQGNPLSMSVTPTADGEGVKEEGM